MLADALGAGEVCACAAADTKQSAVKGTRQSARTGLIISYFMDLSFNMEWGLASHTGTSASTALAGFGAALAMRHGVFDAFSGANFAHLGAKRAHCLHVVVAARDRRRGKAAHIGALHVQRDAANHCFGVVFLEAGAGALKARSGTFVARKKAFFLDLTKHFNLQ